MDATWTSCQKQIPKPGEVKADSGGVVRPRRSQRGPAARLNMQWPRCNRFGASLSPIAWR